MLNERQQEAVNKIEGPLLIIAGAGSGKTSTLTARVNHMVKEVGIHPESIMCVTFTNKAGGEMKEKIASVLGRGVPKYLGAREFPLIGTFHSIGVFILRQDIEKIGFNKDFVILDEQDKLSVVKEITKSMHLDDKVYPPRNITFHISNAKNSLVSPSEYTNFSQNDFTKVVSEVYTRYEKRLGQLNALDFDDILLKTLAVLKIPEVLEKYQEKYKYIMVDEYQDTNAPQYNIVKLLASKYRNLAVVGDDWQSIYSWRGADMTNIINFKKDYKEALVVKLEQNYRSTKAIIESANAIIKNNQSALDKTLFTDNEEGEKIKYMEAFDDKAEARDIVKHIVDAGTSFKDNLVLYRTNGQSRGIEEALIKKGVPYRVIGGQKFYERKEIKDLLGYLKIVHNPNDAVSMNRVINTPTRKIGAKSVDVINAYVNEYGLSYDDVLSNADEIAELKPQAKASVLNFSKIYKMLIEASNQVPVEELIKLTIKKTQYEEYINAQYPSKEEREAKMENINELINVASEYTGLEPKESLANFLEDVALLTDMDKNEEGDDNKVTLMTVHTSKGLEYDRVFITGLEEGLFPHVRSLSNPTELEEERRLMYVAVTRAKKEVYISRARERYSFGQYSQNPASRFIKEFPEQYLEKLEVSNKSYFNNSFVPKGGLLNEGAVSTRPASPISKSRINNVADFGVGDRVEHPKFGNGVIKSISGDLGDIVFSGVGIKKMSLKIAPIKKL